MTCFLIWYLIGLISGNLFGITGLCLNRMAEWYEEYEECARRNYPKKPEEVDEKFKGKPGIEFNVNLLVIFMALLFALFGPLYVIVAFVYMLVMGVKLLVCNGEMFKTIKTFNFKF